jgi:uncharacterized protein (DUF1330 family)
MVQYGAMPACYIVGDVTVTNPERYKDYASQTESTLEPFGGRFIVRGPEVHQLEGGWSPGRVVVIEFPNRESAQGWYHSDDYQAILPIRQEASTGSLILVEGYSPS